MRWIAVGVWGACGLASSAAWACAPGDVVIDEVMPDPAGADDGAEWVELLNRCADPMDLAGWTLERARSGPADWALLAVVPDGTVLAPGAHLVVAGSAADVPAGAVVVPWLAQGLGNAGATNSDGVRLRSPGGAVVDVVAYGGANVTGQVYADELGVDIDNDRLAPVPAPGRSLARQPDGLDTDHGDDFALATPTPGAANAAPVPCTPGVAGQVVINELLPDPDGADDGFEWVELFASAPVDLAGWRLEQAGAPEHWGGRVRFTFPEGSEVAAGDTVLVAEDGVDVAGLVGFVVPDGGRLQLGNSQDAVRLVDCAGGVQDTIVYGGANPDGFVGDNGQVIPDASVAPAVVAGASLARRADGVDTDDCARDVVVDPHPTPAAPNPDRTCRGLAGDVVVNELLPDPAGLDALAHAEFVELYHRGSAALDVSGWTLSKVTRQVDDGPTATLLTSLPAGTVLAPGGFLLVAGVQVDGADVYVDHLDLGSGAGGDQVVLTDCAGTRADSVLYGGANDDGLAEDDGAVPAQGAPDASEDGCIARRIDGGDSDRSVDDLVATVHCTPGASNVRETGPAIETEGNGPGEGCAGGPVVAAPVVVSPETGGGCSTVPGARWGAWALAGLALLLLRRRR
ncbi:MAG: lamin tail domain-containing protein [Alphaproteobacteria bacterium]|nr:lamin tail domain-containing protein [Alphaproteobacteria bacterium]